MIGKCGVRIFWRATSPYPILAYYRSQHEQQSWVGALTLILDTCALILTTMTDGTRRTGKRRFTFAMARHAVVDLAQVFNISPPTAVDRLSSAEFTQLQEMLRKRASICGKGRQASRSWPSYARPMSRL